MNSKNEQEDDDDERWGALLWDYLNNDQVDVDERWGSALELLQQFENPIEVLILLAVGATAPDWVRAEIAAWLRGERPKLPKIREDDEPLLAAARAFRATPTPRGERDQKVERIAAEYKIGKDELDKFLTGESGGTYKRLVTDLNRWKRAYAHLLKPDAD